MRSSEIGSPILTSRYHVSTSKSRGLFDAISPDFEFPVYQPWSAGGKRLR